VLLLALAATRLFSFSLRPSPGAQGSAKEWCPAAAYKDKDAAGWARAVTCLSHVLEYRSLLTLDRSLLTLDRSLLTLDRSLLTLGRSLSTLDRSILKLVFDTVTIQGGCRCGVFGGGRNSEKSEMKYMVNNNCLFFSSQELDALVSLSRMWAFPFFWAALVIMINDNFSCCLSQDMDGFVSMSLMWAVPIFAGSLVSKGYSGLTQQLSRFRFGV
jgi:hypothetical protein